MNYAGKFDAKFFDGSGLHPAGNAHVDSFSLHAHGSVPTGAFVVPDPDLLFNGEFKRSGVDLVLSKDGHEFVVHDYFKGGTRAAIASPDGAHLTGDLVYALTGEIQYSQAGADAGHAVSQVIGHVTKLSGSATAIRNGVSIILNQGDNVEKGDVVQTGSDSTVGITFIDGTVFGLSANARMVLNEMVYDPNGSNNSSLMSLIAGTITFVAGATAKHGDMKIDTPVATMGIRGTAVLTEIHFIIPQGGGDAQPEANFQVLVEPDGTTGSYILFDKTTLLPIATVNQAGQQIHISGGNVTVSNALLSPDVQKLITDVFSLKFTDNSNNTKNTTNFTDTVTPDPNGMIIKTASGAVAIPTFVNTVNTNTPSDKGGNGNTIDRIPGPPNAVVTDAAETPKTGFSLTELTGKTGDLVDQDAVTGHVNFVDYNLGDRPTVQVNFTSFTYKNAKQQDVTSTLSPLQLKDIAATEAGIKVVPDPGNNNNGSATWTYSVPDHAFDFLAAGEKLTLTYMVRVDNNFAPANETTFIPITITVIGTNDAPVITTSAKQIDFSGGTSVPGGPLTSDAPTSGSLSFNDVDLTDTHTVSVALKSADLPGGTVPPGPLAVFEKALSASIATDSTGTGTGTVDWKLADLPVYAADFIPKGETLTLTYTVTVTDSQGATSTKDITVTVTGTDAAAVVWIATMQPGSPPGGLWQDAANWETGTVPTINDDVIIITDQLHGLTPSFPATIDAPAFANSVTMNDFGSTPPELINLNSLTIAATFSVNADAIVHNSGTISVGGKAEFVDHSVLDNSGTITLAAGGDFKDHSSITNTGTIDVSGGTLNVSVDIGNPGLLQVDAGATLALTSATIHGGTVTIAGILDLEGSSFLTSGNLINTGGVNVSGTVVFEAETATNDGAIDITGALTLKDGTAIANGAQGSETVEHGASLTLTDTSSISGGTLTNSGDVYVEASTGAKVDGVAVENSGGTIHVDLPSAAAELILDDGATIANGTVDVGQVGTLDVSSAAGATLSGVAVDVAPLGSVRVETDSRLLVKKTTITGGTLSISGTLDSTGTSTVTNAAIDNFGLIEAIGGLLTLVASNSASIANQGTIEANGGELDITSEPVTNDGTLQAINDSTLKLTSTIVTNAGGSVVAASGSAVSLVDATIDGGKLTIAGALESSGTSAIDHADIAVGAAGKIEVTAGTLTIDPPTSFTNLGTIEADGGELDIVGETLANGGTLEAINGGTLKLSSMTVTNTGTVSVDGTSTLDLASVHVDGGTLNNAGSLFSISGNNIVSAAVTNTGTVEVMAGTLDLSGGLSGVGSLIIDDGATLELAGATAQTVTFAGGTDTLQLDHVAGQSFTGTIAGQSSQGGTFDVTGDANITTAIGNALSFTALGGTQADPADISLTLGGALDGASNGIVVLQKGVGDISLAATGNVTGENGSGIILRDTATGVGRIVVNDTGKATGKGSGSSGLLVENLNAANAGDILISQLGGASGDLFGIDAHTEGNGNVSIEAKGDISSASQYGIRARSYGTGSETVTTDAGTVINSASSGIVAVNRATTLAASADSSITINAYGTINSGTTLNINDSTPGGIIAGYNGARNGSAADTAVNGMVAVNNHADITATAGFGIKAYDYGNGDVTVNDAAGTKVVGADIGIVALAMSGGTGNVTVAVGANATIEGTAKAGIKAFSVDAGSITVSTAQGDQIKSGGSGIVAVNQATAIAAGVHSTIHVTAYGSIHSGGNDSGSGALPGAIVAGYNPGGTAQFNDQSQATDQVAGDVVVENYATLTADAGFGIEAFTWGTGNVTVTAGTSSSITAAGTAIGAAAEGGGDVSVTNKGSATGAVGIAAIATGAGAVGITNDGEVAGTSGVGIKVNQDAAGATGSTHITNSADASIVGASGFAAILIHENATGAATIDNAGTIGPGVVTPTSYAIVETGGPVTINNTGAINGNVNVATATFNNELGGTWTVAGTSIFGVLSSTTVSTIDNAGKIDLLDSAAIYGLNGLDVINAGEIDSTSGATSVTADITNSGIIDVTGGVMTIGAAGSVVSTGLIEANGGTLIINSSLSGTATILGASKIELGADTSSAYSSATITFGAAATGILKFDHSETFSGKVAGFDDGKLDLGDISYSTHVTASYAGDASGGVLTIVNTDNPTQTAQIHLTGDYLGSSWNLSSDGSGGTYVSETPGAIAGLDEHGNAVENATLTASITDAGQTVTNASYQWLLNGVAIENATAASYTPGESNEGQHLSVRLTFTDSAGTVETTTISAGTVQEEGSEVAKVALSGLDGNGNAVENQQVTATLNETDAPSSGILYTWTVNGNVVHSGLDAAGATYTPGEADQGGALQVSVSFTDTHGNAETGTVAGGTVQEEGSEVAKVALSGLDGNGNAVENQQVTATVNETDAPSSGILYTWTVNGNVVHSGLDAAGATYTPGEADEGGALQVSVSFTDTHGNAETGTVAGGTVQEEGSEVAKVALSGLDGNGNAVENQQVTATVNETDAPSSGILYTWTVNGAVVHSGLDAAGATYTPGAADDGGALQVTVSFTDTHGFSETGTASALVATPVVNPPVPPVNPPPIDQPPVAAPVTLAAGVENAAYTVRASDLLTGVTDPDGPFPLSISALTVASGGGSLVDNHDGTWTYTPATGYAGPVSFDYTASDGSLTSSSTASLTLVAPIDNWTGKAEDGKWNTAGNWDLLHVPTVYDIANVDAHGTVNLSLDNHGYSIAGLDIAAGTQLDATGTGYVEQAGGVASYFLISGALNNAGTILVNGAILDAFSHVTNSGTIEAQGRYSILDFAGSAANTIDNAGGTIEALNGGTAFLGNDTVNGGQIDALGEGSVIYLDDSYLNGVTLHGSSTGHFEVLGGTTTFDGSAAAVSIVASTKITEEFGATLILKGIVNDSGSVTDNGTLYVADGALVDIAGNLTGSGTVQIGAALLEVGGASNSAMQFVGSGVGTLKLDQPAQFTGSATGFSYGDTIDLAGIDTSKVSIVSHNGVLEVHYGTGPHDFFTITGGYNAAGFSVTSDGHNGTDIVWTHQSPVIETDQFTVTQNPDHTDTVTNLHILGSPTETYTMTAVTETSGTSVTPSSTTGSLTAIENALSSGVVYNPGATPPSIDKVTLTVTDSLGASDTVNFIFNEAGSGNNLVLQGTGGKDVIFASGNQDTLTGGAGADQFVFKPSSSVNQDTITDFTPGQDHIDIRAFSSTVDSSNIGAWLASHAAASPTNGSDLVVTLDNNDSVVLKNVALANLHASDFIVSPHPII